MTIAAADDDGSIIEILEREMLRLLLCAAVTVASVPVFAAAVAVGVCCYCFRCCCHYY